MSRYDGLIIPRSYSEYINKTDAAALSQALALPGVMDATPTESSNKAARSGGIYSAIKNKQTINPSTNINLPETNDEINFYKLSLNNISIDGIKSTLINYGFQNIRTGTSFIELLGPDGQRFIVILSHSGTKYFGGILITFYYPITYIRYNNGTWE